MELAQAYVQIVPSAKGIGGGIEKAISGQAASAGKAGGISLGNNLVGSVMKIVAAAGIGAAIKSSLDAGGALQQSFGGLDTLYGDASAQAKAYAKDAAKAGISMNDYAEQAVRFGASLKAAYGGDTAAAVEAANVAILDMADNSAKMGTDIQAVQNAYAGFAKQNYTMLDNLALGYGGTKTEMERLLVDAEKISGVHYDLDNLGDVYSAIHVIQEDLKLTGVAADEAEGTFTGSMGAMKASLENLKAELATGGDITGSLQVLMTSAGTFLTKNLLPMIGNVFKGLPEVIKTAIGGAVSGMNLLSENMLGIADEGITIVAGLADAILSGLPLLAQAFLNLIQSAFSALTSWNFQVTALNLLTTLKNNLLTTAQSVLGVSDGAGIMTAITSGISQAIPNFFASILPIISGFSEWLLANAPVFLQAGIDIVMSIVDGIVNTIPLLITQVPQIVTNFANVINQNAPTVFKAGWDMIVRLGEGIINNIPLIIANIGQIVQAIFAVIQAVNWINLGGSILKLLGSGIKNMIGFVVNFAKEFVRSFGQTIRTFDWIGLGKSIVTGLINGVKALAGEFGKVILGMAGEALAGIKSFFGIGSPSKVMRDEVGRWIPAGLALGITDNAGAVTDAMRDIVDDATNFGLGSLTMYPGQSNSADLAERLENLTVNANVTLQGDARKIFKVVRQDNATLSRATGYNLLGGYT